MDWIAGYAKDEAEFEVLREQVNFNFMYTGKFFVKLEEIENTPEIVWLGK